MLIFAEVVPDALSGGAGWLGAGLLGAVLAWLMFKHLPAKDAQVQTLIELHNAQMDAASTSHAEQNKQTRTDFQNSLQTIVNHCEREMGSIVERFSREIDSLRTSIREQPNGRKN